MVDLVKIRKKAKKKKEEAEESSSRRADEPTSGETPVATPEAGESAAAPRSGVAGEPASEKPAPRGKKPKTATAAATGASAPDVHRDVRQHDRDAISSDEEAAAAAGQAPAESKLDRFKQIAGKRRDAETVEEEDETETRLELLTFMIAGEQYAIDIEHIVEIVTPRRLTRIPNADPTVVGIVSLRGTIVTLVDVRRKLRHPPAGAPDEETRIVVVDFHDETIGFVVDRVLRVVKASPEEIEPHPVVHATELDESVRGVFRTGGALTILLDFEKLLDHSALAAVTA